MKNHEGSNATGQRDQCPKCEDSGRDNRVWYDDGHAFCFACNTHWQGEGQGTQVAPTPVKDWTPLQGAIRALPERGISENTCRVYGYRVMQINGKLCHVADFVDNGHIVAQKIRAVDTKEFAWRGNASKSPLFGQHLWKAGGKKLVITEGEIDALSVAETQDCKWPVVSIPSGAAGAVKAIQNNYDFVTSFREIILMFDMDEAGQAAARKVADILPAGRVYIAALSRKDPNELLTSGGREELRSAIWNAKGYRPDGILHVREVQPQANSTEQRVWSFPWPRMTEFLIGQRSGEITMWTSGTGSGKSTIIREIVSAHLESDRTVGMLMLEESPDETLDDLLSLYLNKPIKHIRAYRALNKLRSSEGQDPIEFEDTLTDEEYNDALAHIRSKNLFIYDSFGLTAAENIVSQVDYMATALECDVIVLDHITAAVTNMMSGDGVGKGEREAIDEVMHNLRGIVTRTGCHIDIVSQLRKPATGVGYEEGARIRTGDLRGSGALGSVPNTIIAMERNRQDPDPRTANTSVMRVLKNRFTGKTGVAAALYYDSRTSRLDSVDFSVSGDGNVELSPSNSEF